MAESRRMTQPPKKTMAALIKKGLSVFFVLLAGAAILPIACSKHSQTPAVTTRSFRMGFMSSAPRPDIQLYLESLALWTQHADATIISTELPWDSLLNGENPVTYVVDNYVELVNYCRSTNMKLWVYLDPANGLNRASDSDPLVARGKSIAQADIQQVYRRFVFVVDSILRPDHLGLALETNLIRLAAPDSIYEGVKRAAGEAAADVRASRCAGSAGGERTGGGGLGQTGRIQFRGCGAGLCRLSLSAGIGNFILSLSRGLWHSRRYPTELLFSNFGCESSCAYCLFSDRRLDFGDNDELRQRANPFPAIPRRSRPPILNVQGAIRN